MNERREQVLSELLENVAKNEQLVDYKYEFATGLNKKDGFVSSMYHVKLIGREESATKKTLHIIIKFAPTNEKFRNSMPIKEAFRREILLYDTVIPLMEDMLERVGLTPRLDYISKFYGSTLEDYHEAVLLENLKHAKYELWDYKKPMNDKHIRYVLKSYGKFHANGFALKHLYPKVFEEKFDIVRQSLMFDGKSDEYMDFMEEQMGEIAKGLSDPADSELYEVFLRHKVNILNIMRDNTDIDEYSTLLHGDCWCNNVMFQYDDETKNEPSGMKFLDWQLLCQGSLVKDFTYFFYSNASPDMYDRLEEYKDVYYDSLTKQLKALNLDSNRVYPRDIFDKQMKRYAKFGMSMALLIIHVKLFKDEMKDHEDTNGTDESIFDQFNCENRDMTEFYKMSNVLIRHCHKNGFL